MPRRIVFAPDSFKGSLDAADAAEALARGWLRAHPDDEAVLRPMADGGEGTLDAFALAVPGAVRVPVRATGPDGRSVEAHWLRMPGAAADGGDLGLVELASTSGITLLDPLRPVDAHTLGFGEAIAAALDAGVAGLLLAIGGSSSTDGGAGALVALGAVLEDASGATIPPGARGLEALARVDLSGLRALPPAGVRVLSDVTNPLTGPRGAAAVFGPQKGATPDLVPVLDAALADWASALSAAGRVVDPATPGAGAAGGTGFGLLAWGAELVGGADAVADAIGLRAAIAAADLVVTGEGRFDDQSLDGKVPALVLDAAAAAGGIQVALVAGGIAPDARPIAADRFTAAIALTDLAGSVDAARADAARWLEAAGERLAG
ncbi:glycerate kinase [Agromyces seonyuensis]|uniref:Glycerate kinase n=1 Tax=Agromyces seonyuensis TaxID=2662446 RepID=A0A6I4NZU0_9MICO|nr:glycerate kinase [Agromyces seonyuensis]MWB99836.1 glycerate kinase [Agromyces seonyuensis]